MNPLDHLIQKYLDQIATPDELAELQALVVANPLAADALARATRLDVALHSALNEERHESDALQIADDFRQLDRPRRQTWAWALGLAVSLAFVLAGVALWSFLARENEANTYRVESGSVAVDGLEPLADPNLVPINRGVTAKLGSATIRMPDGSTTRLAEDSTVVFHGSSGPVRERVELRSGSANFVVSETAGRFVVETPVGIVTVLGTIFDVQLIDRPIIPEEGDEMLTRTVLTVAVLAGGVQVEHAGQTYRIAAGDSRVFGDEPARADFKTDPRRDADLSGKLLKYDAAKGTVLIGSGGEGKTETTLLVDKAIQVLLDSKPGKLGDIPEGTNVRLFLNNDRSTAVFIQANGPTQRKVITEVDAAKRTLNFKREGGTGAIAVASDAVITIDGRDAKLEDLKPGTQAILWMTMDQKTVRFISVPKKRVVGGGEGDKPRKEGDRKDGEKKEGDKK